MVRHPDDHDWDHTLGGLHLVGQRLYRRLGWVVWRGPSFVASPAGRVATPEEDGYVLVLPQPGLDLNAPITCDWRDGDVCDH